jgi:hypothetical protein
MPRMVEHTAKRSPTKRGGERGEKKLAKVKYEPPRLTKFDQLQKLIVCGE